MDRFCIQDFKIFPRGCGVPHDDKSLFVIERLYELQYDVLWRISLKSLRGYIDGLRVDAHHSITLSSEKSPTSSTFLMLEYLLLAVNARQ